MLRTYDIQEVPNLKIHGRTVNGSSPLPLFWNHSGIEVNCTGSELWIELECAYEFHEIWVAVEINHALIARQMLYPGHNSLCLFRSMIPGIVKNVRFYRDLQAMNDNPEMHLLVKALKTDGEFLPVEDKKLKLELIGDSITSGEGTYGSRKDMEWLAMYMSASRNYVTLLERMLDADCRAISQGGWGVYSAYNNDRSHNIPSFYDRICGMAKGPFNEELGAQREYDFSSWVPDAIIVNLGTNDDSSFNNPGMEVPGYGFCKNRSDADGNPVEEDLNALSSAIVDFLKLLRSKNPTSHILWVYGMLGDRMKPVIMRSIDRYKSDSGDTNVAYMHMPDTDALTVGSRNHPGYAGHLEAAKSIGKYLAQRFNTEFDDNIVL